MLGSDSRGVNEGTPARTGSRRIHHRGLVANVLWIKAFHVIFVIAWFAGLLYLPRLFVYHASSEDRLSRDRFALMERKLFTIMSLGGGGALAFGLWLLHRYTWAVHHDALWLHLKLVLVAALVAFHLFCAKLMRDLREDAGRYRPAFFRVLNEVPALLMVAVVLLVVVKKPV